MVHGGIPWGMAGNIPGNIGKHWGGKACGCLIRRIHGQAGDGRAGIAVPDKRLISLTVSEQTVEKEVEK